MRESGATLMCSPSSYKPNLARQSLAVNLKPRRYAKSESVLVSANITPNVWCAPRLTISRTALKLRVTTLWESRNMCFWRLWTVVRALFARSMTAKSTRLRTQCLVTMFHRSTQTAARLYVLILAKSMNQNSALPAIRGLVATHTSTTNLMLSGRKPMA